MKLRYFAWVRERIGHSEEEIELPPGVSRIDELIGWLAARDEDYAAAFAAPDVIRTAIDRIHVPHDAAIGGAREIGFFPPMTGG